MAYIFLLLPFNTTLSCEHCSAVGVYCSLIACFLFSFLYISLQVAPGYLGCFLIFSHLQHRRWTLSFFQAFSFLGYLLLLYFVSQQQSFFSLCLCFPTPLATTPPKHSNLGRHHYETQRKCVIRPDNVINNNVIIWHRAAFAYDRLKHYF